MSKNDELINLIMEIFEVPKAEAKKMEYMMISYLSVSKMKPEEE